MDRRRVSGECGSTDCDSERWTGIPEVTAFEPGVVVTQNERQKVYYINGPRRCRESHMRESPDPGIQSYVSLEDLLPILAPQ